MVESPTRSVVVLADVGGEQFHVGDEAMLAANLATLRGASASVTVLGRDAGADAIGAAVARAGAALVSGGGNLSESWPELLEQRVVLLEQASRRRVPAALGGQTIGPALGEGARSRLAAALATATLVGTRELASTALALDLGLGLERVVHQVDDAFGLTGQAPDDDRLLAVAETPYLAVTLDGSYAADSALAGLRSLAAQLVVLAQELRLAVMFVPHVGALGEHHGDDPAVGRRLGELLRLAGTRCASAPVLPVAQAVWLSRQSALTISSRYHPLVFASAAGRPCFGLYRDAYTRVKISGALAHVGAQRRCLPTLAAEAGRLTPAVRALWADAEEVTGRMQEVLPAISSREAERRRRLLRELKLSDLRDTTTQEARLLGWVPQELALHTIRRVSFTEEPSVDAVAAPSPAAAPTQPAASRDVTDAEWEQFARDGFMPLGRVLQPEEVQRLAQRADDLAAGRVINERVQMQIDTGGAYEELPAAVASFDAPTQLYRKIQGLEADDEFVALVRHPRFFEVCAHIYGPHVPLAVFRAMVMNKPAGQGTLLPWHQDGGDVWGLDREPLVTIWVALDAATIENGCMEAVRGSHRVGLLTQYGSTLSESDAAEHCVEERVVPLELEAGHAVLMHNWLIHRSGVNRTSVPRRAVTICYVDGRTRRVTTGDQLPLVSGSVDPAPHPYVRQLVGDVVALRTSATRGEEYARSLEETLAASQLARAEAERYAQSLEVERARLEAALAAAEGPALSDSPVRGSRRNRLRRERG